MISMKLTELMKLIKLIKSIESIEVNKIDKKSCVHKTVFGWCFLFSGIYIYTNGKRTKFTLYLVY